jgi:hypothetical protein
MTRFGLVRDGARRAASIDDHDVRIDETSPYGLGEGQFSGAQGSVATGVDLYSYWLGLFRPRRESAGP